MTSSVLEQIKIAAKNLIESKNGTPITGKTPTLNQTIESIIEATTPARKAHATRKLRVYAIKHADEINSTPNRVIAGVCAAVTKRIQGKSEKPKKIKESDRYRAVLKEIERLLAK